LLISTHSTSIFFLLSVVVLLSELFAPATGSRLMAKYGPNTAYLIGIAGYIMAFIILLCIPETAKLNNPSEHERAASTDSSPTAPTDDSKLRQRLEALLDHVRTDLIPILSRGTIMRGLIAVLVNNFARPIFAILIQYMSAQFQWKFERVSIVNCKKDLICG
jgi:hypothetical protein